ncbi:hypothetical protein SISNIDRAFT_482411 [Sistotremastrum niveocremeum HHB9708]|uniref:F-box domain-containing protein n=1 Tax=Sistotremastrum niveocremeum HHB9708 TaxID=1314777 RepID=A0A164Y614_9AGAM|nr:hypothetical protein SISNIDRAFT_482411 [Sistotremastrum niveocremeum HHB9708]
MAGGTPPTSSSLYMDPSTRLRITISPRSQKSPSWSSNFPSRAMIQENSAVKRMPVELWRMILRLTTIIPGGLTMDYSSFIDFHTVKWEITDGYRAALQTKRNLTLVSRGFRDIAKSYLYELINIEDAPMLLALALQVGNPLDSATPVGPLIRRLEIREHDSLRLNPVATGEVLSYLVYRCLNLRILCGDTLLVLPQVPTHLMPCLNLSALERIGVPIITREDAIQFSHLLPRLPKLKALRLRMSAVGSERLILRSQHVSMMSTNIDANCLPDSIRAWSLPSLEHLALIAPTEAQFTTFQPFFRAHGPRLVSCHIYEPEHSSTLLTLILRSFSNLASLAYPFSIHPLMPDGLTMKNLKEIGWTFDSRDSGVVESQDLERQAALLRPDSVPALREIRLQYMYFDTLGPDCCVPGSSYISLTPSYKCVDTPMKRRERKWWTRYCQKWRSRGVEVRDREGFLLKP